MTKNLKSFRLTKNSLEKIQKIQTEKQLDDQTQALEHIISNFDMASTYKPVPKLQNIEVRL